MDKKMVVRHSENLGEDLVANVYGTAGQPIVAFAPQSQAPENLEDVGLVDELADYLDAGVVQLFCVNNVDGESWGGTGDPAARAARQEAYYQAVCDELVPLVHEVSGTDARPLALGFDLGATHAAIFALRRPDLFQGCICLSGIYDSRRYFGDWMDSTLYDSTPCAFLPNMPEDHPYVAVYNQRQLLFCCGQEASEAESLRTTREIDANLVRLGVEAWCDYWGGDVSHTWFWWKKQIRYFLPIVLEDVEKTTAAEKPAPKKAPAKRRVTARKPAARKTPAKKVAAEKDVKAEKPAAAEKPATIAKAEKAAAPAKAEKAATPAKATKAATPAKATKAAAPAKVEDAPAKTEAKPAAKKATTRKATTKATATKAAKAETATKTADAKDAEAKPAAKKTAAKKTAAKSTATKAAATKSSSAKSTAAKTTTKSAAAKSATAKASTTKSTAKSTTAKSAAAKTAAKKQDTSGK